MFEHTFESRIEKTYADGRPIVRGVYVDGVRVGAAWEVTAGGGGVFCWCLHDPAPDPQPLTGTADGLGEAVSAVISAWADRAAVAKAEAHS